MRTLRTCLFAFFLVAAPAAVLAQGVCSAPRFAPDKSFIVVDDGNNLREWGGKNYAAAPILRVVNALEEVKLLRREGRWAEVEARDGLRGWINAKCLAPYAQFVARNARTKDSMVAGCADLHENLSFPLDIESDGAMETMRLSCAPGVGCANFTIKIVTAWGKTIFRGPTYGDSPLIFCLCDAGTYWPELVGDLDGDGRAELLAEYGPSDVSVSSFYLGRWNGRGFETAQNGAALLEDPARPETFLFSPYPEGEGASEVRWIMGFSGRGPGGLPRGAVYQYQGDPAKGYALFYGEALFTPIQGGFRLKRWTKPFAKTF